MPRTNVGFSTREAAKCAGITQRMAAYWATTLLLVPSVLAPTGTGNFRRYSIPDVLALAALGAMRAHDLSLQALREVLIFLNDLEEGSAFQDVRGRLVYAPGGKRGRDVALMQDAEIISMLREPGQYVSIAVVDLGELDRQVRERLGRVPQERKERKIEKANRRAERQRALSSTRRRIGERAA